jgi:DNA-binding NarL/FixJ family response regulator
VKKRPRVLLADDHRIVAEGLKSVLTAEFDVVGVVEDGAALVASARDLKPDVIVADISMPRLSGLEALDQLKEANPAVKVVFLTMHTEVAYARRALAAGAAGYVLKHSATTELVLAARTALKGETFVTPALAGALLHRGRTRSHDQAGPSLTPRQREILELLAGGRSAKETADVLSISTRTVEFHKYQMMQAWGIQNSAELVSFAIKNGIVRI